MSSSILDPFRLDSLFRAYRLAPKKDDVPADTGDIDGFTSVFFCGAARNGKENGATKKELNSIKRLTSSQGRSFLKTLADIKTFFDSENCNDGILKSNAALLYSHLEDTDTSEKSFLTYVKNSLDTRFLLPDEKRELEKAVLEDPALALLISFRHAYLHLDHVTEIAAKTQYDAVKTLYPGSEARLRVCQELAPFNEEACVEYADWLDDEMGDKSTALSFYMLHPQSSLCLWQTANKLRQSNRTGDPALSDRQITKIEKTLKKHLRKTVSSYTDEQLHELSSMRYKGDSRALKLAYELFFSLTAQTEDFCKAYTSLAQMLSSGEAFLDNTEETSKLMDRYYEKAISGGDVIPVLNISNHLATLMANALIKPIGTEVSMPDEADLIKMRDYNRQALNLGMRSCKLTEIKIKVCESIMEGRQTDKEEICDALRKLEAEDAALPVGVSRVFIERSEYWALRAEYESDTDTRIRCLEKALEIEEEKGYDHIPQLSFYLALEYSRCEGRDDKVTSLLEKHKDLLLADERYSEKTASMLGI